MSNQKIESQKLSGLLFPLLLALYEAGIYLSNDAYLPALPYISHDLNASHYLIQLTLTAWFMGSASMQLILGPISDHIGRRPVLLFGGLIFVLLTIACSLANNIYLLLILRIFQGATIASMVVAGYATIHEIFDRNQAIHTLALMNSIVILAPAFGPLFGAVILYFTNWRWIFGSLAIWAGIALCTLYFNMPETKKNNNPQKIRLKNILIQYKNILLNKFFILPAMTSQLLFAALIAWITAGPFLVINQFHLKPLTFAILQAIIFSSFIIGTRSVKILMNICQPKTIIKSGILLSFCGGSYALLSSLIWPTILSNMIIAMVLLACGTGLALPVLSRLAIEASDEPMGSRVAIWSSLMSGTGMFGSAIISSMYNERLYSLGLAFFIFSAISLMLYIINTNTSRNS